MGIPVGWKDTCRCPISLYPCIYTALETEAAGHQEQTSKDLAKQVDGVKANLESVRLPPKV